MQQRFILTLSILLLSTASSHSADKSAVDLKAMQGDWSISKQVFNGKEIPEEQLKALEPQLSVKKDVYEVSFKSEVIDKGKLTLDASKTPKHLNTESTSGANKGMKMKGIYKIKGETMTVIFAQPGADRPQNFTSKEGNNHILIVYQKKLK